MKAHWDDDTLVPWRGSEPGTVVLEALEVRPAVADELPRVAALLKEQHDLGSGRQVGRTLVQIVHHRGRWAAILIWGPAALKLIDRDEWIGWTSQQRAERIGLIVQNRRFLVLAETFTDIESFEGTCYKASNWEPCGLTKGFKRHHRADFGATKPSTTCLDCSTPTIWPTRSTDGSPPITAPCRAPLRWTANTSAIWFGPSL